MMYDSNNQHVIFACLLDTSEHSSIPEYQSHSFNETAASSAEGTTFSKKTFLYVLALTSIKLSTKILCCIAFLLPKFLQPLKMQDPNTVAKKGKLTKCPFYLKCISLSSATWFILDLTSPLAQPAVERPTRSRVAPVKPAPAKSKTKMPAGNLIKGRTILAHSWTLRQLSC